MAAVQSRESDDAGPSRSAGSDKVFVEAAERSAEDAVEAAQDFILEQYLEEFLDATWDRINFGRRLELYSPDSRPARQFDATPAGLIDFLCRDPDTNALVVVELKRGSPSDSVVGQTLRYMGWVKSELADEQQRVEGIIVVGDADPRLLLAASITPGLRVLQYRIDFRLEPADWGVGKASCERIWPLPVSPTCERAGPGRRRYAQEAGPALRSAVLAYALACRCPWQASGGHILGTPPLRDRPSFGIALSTGANMQVFLTDAGGGT
jgi:hypothetical protein